MKNLIVVFVSLFVFTLTYSQPASHTDFTKGYIIDLDGKEVICKIKSINFTTIKIRFEDEKKIVKANQILEYGVGASRFIVYPFRKPREQSYNDNESSYMFLEIILKGKINLYALHYAQNIGVGMSAWGVKYYFQKREEALVGSKKKRKDNIRLLQSLVADNTKLFNSIDWKKFGKGLSMGSHDDVYKLIDDYNKESY